MLCFVKEDIAFWVLDKLFLQFLPENFMNEDFLQIEMKIMIELAKSSKIFKDIQLKTHENLIIYCLELFFRSIFVNILTFQTTYFIWDNLFSSGSVNKIIIIINIFTKILVSRIGKKCPSLSKALFPKR